ncbi:hypothetical protein PR202_ga20828 [Eleusine coracana subsp. coracana]|uniref:WRKY domain-containing protein n=1 Tax=Eleusine coracana subsp. coracana TaxID=191504 RepID=A0AAV5CXN0_ELECO|nr:hypothetical protein PR202_ga20828 [Eleusine coracana subsp. coracana]
MEQHQLVSELCRVQELVRELDLHLHSSSPSSVAQCRRLAAEIVALTDRSIAMAATTTPPCSGAPSPLSDAGSDHPQHPFNTSSPKKRKATARWHDQVRVTATGGADDDGHSWRKYGQKDILGARHPRAYYRCTHRNSQGCPATKQVQRTDNDAGVFDVVYHGEHTCRPSVPRRQNPSQQQQHNPGAESLLQGLAARLTVATDAVGVAVPPMTPPESCPARGAASPWSLASPIGSDGYGGDLQEAVSAFAMHQTLDAAEFMQQENYFGFDYQSFDMDPMPSLFFQ